MSERPGSGHANRDRENQDRENQDRENHALFARLARIVDELDPVPPLAYELGRAAFTLGRIDAELIELVGDSALETDALVGVRGAGDARLLSFEAADLDVDVQVIPQAGRRSLLGQVAGPVASVRVETATGGMIPTVVDRCGRFQVADTPPGRIRLHVDAAGTSYVTSWVII